MPDIAVGLGGLLGEAEVGHGCLWGQVHCWRRPQEIIIAMSSLGDRHLGTDSWPQPTAYRLQCRDASGQTTNKVGTQPHPPADRLPKVFLTPQLPLNKPSDKALPTKGTRPSSTHQWAGTSLSNQEAYTSLWTNLTNQGADTRSKKNYSPAN